MLDLYNVINQVVLADIYRGTFHTNTKEYFFFSEFIKRSPELTAYLDTEQVSTDIKILKLYHVPF